MIFHDKIVRIYVSTKERYSFDVAKLLRKIDVVSMETLDFSKPTTVMSNSPINQYVYNRVSKIKPYFTNKELVDIFIECVGNRQIYFAIKLIAFYCFFGKI